MKSCRYHGHGVKGSGKGLEFGALQLPHSGGGGGEYWMQPHGGSRTTACVQCMAAGVLGRVCVLPLPMLPSPWDPQRAPCLMRLGRGDGPGVRSGMGGVQACPITGMSLLCLI